MTDIDKKREEIREGLGVLFKEMGLGETISTEDFVEQINRFYHSQGVVIKDKRFGVGVDTRGGYNWKDTYFVIPLIEEK